MDPWNKIERQRIYWEITAERIRQEKKFGARPGGAIGGLPLHERVVVLMEEAGEVAHASLAKSDGDVGLKNDGDYRAELVQVAAVAVAMIEAHDEAHADTVRAPA